MFTYREILNTLKNMEEWQLDNQVQVMVSRTCELLLPVITLDTIGNLLVDSMDAEHYPENFVLLISGVKLCHHYNVHKFEGCMVCKDCGYTYEEL